MDLRSDDSSEPIGELQRMLDLHGLDFRRTPEADLLGVDPALEHELRERLSRVGYATGDVQRDLYGWMGRENFEERWVDGRIDPVVLTHLRTTTG